MPIPIRDFSERHLGAPSTSTSTTTSTNHLNTIYETTADNNGVQYCFIALLHYIAKYYKPSPDCNIN